VIADKQTEDRGRYVTYYHTDSESINLLNRYAWYIQATEELFGEMGKDLAVTILMHGKCNAHVLLKDKDAEYQDVFNDMLTSGFINAVAETVHQTSIDLQFALEEVEVSKLEAPPTVSTLVTYVVLHEIRG